MGDDDDACVHGLLEDGFDGTRVDGDHADRVDALGDEVLDDLGLHGGVGFSGALLEDVYARVRGVLVDARFHTDKPRVGGVLGDDGDRVVAVSGGLAARGRGAPVRRASAECEGACRYGDECCCCEAGLHRNSSGCGQRRCWGCGCARGDHAGCRRGGAARCCGGAVARRCCVPGRGLLGHDGLSRLAAVRCRSPAVLRLRTVATVRPRCAGLAVC